MKMPVVDPALLEVAREGRIEAVDRLLRSLEPAVFALSVRMLGHREDARDACQEILLKVVTHLGSFRGEATFTTWVFQIARNHLLRAATRVREAPDVSFEALAERLDAGLGIAAALRTTVTPEDEVAARELGVRCTAGMLLALDRDQRLAYLLDLLFGMTSEVAAEVIGIAPAAYRKRLSRAREALHGHAETRCGHVNPDAGCRCVAQVSAYRLAGRVLPSGANAVFDGLVQVGDAASLFRALPEEQAPAAMVEAIRSVLRIA